MRVCPQAADVVEVFIYLSEPSHVCQLLLTVAHGSDDLTFPSTVDVRCGRDLDGLKLVLEGAFIPQCANGTNIVIPLLGLVSSEDMAVTGAGVHLGSSEASHLALLYDFKELEAELEFLTRAVALTFYPPISGRTPITLGEGCINDLVPHPVVQILSFWAEMGSGFQSSYIKFTRTSFWLSDTIKKLLGLQASAANVVKENELLSALASPFKAGFASRKSRDQYLEDVEKGLTYIKDGQSYELCLTTQLRNKISNLDTIELKIFCVVLILLWPEAILLLILFPPSHAGCAWKQAFLSSLGVVMPDFF
ncbi:hypothetical protein Dimus_022994, partial [Dionaea muscipula]